MDGNGPEKEKPVGNSCVDLRVRISQETWKLCEKLNADPLKGFEEILGLGKKVLKVMAREGKGELIWRKAGGEEIRILGNNGQPHSLT
jgi:hypothetical protein